MSTHRTDGEKVVRICRLMTRQEQAIQLWQYIRWEQKQCQEYGDMLSLLMLHLVPWAFLNRGDFLSILGDNPLTQHRWDTYCPACWTASERRRQDALKAHLRRKQDHAEVR